MAACANLLGNLSHNKLSAPSLKTHAVMLPATGSAVSHPPRFQDNYRQAGPSTWELVVLWLLSGIVFIIVLSHFESYSAKVLAFADNTEYISAANAIRHWDFQNTHTRQGWGLSYLIALLSTAQLTYEASLLLISIGASLASVLLVSNLWGPWIAAFFAILNFPWIQASFLGSSEPLFVLLLFGSFWFSRREFNRNELNTNQRSGEQSTLAASALAALATLTRAVGIFGLTALGLDLLIRKQYRKLALSIVIGALFGFLYLLPFWTTFHDPLYQFHRRALVRDWDSGGLVSWPFRSIVVSYLYYRGPWTNVLLTGGWIGLSAAALFRMVFQLFRDKAEEYRTEQIFTITYLSFLFCYNSLYWARWDFHRFVIPAIPLILLSFYRWLPKSRYVVYPLCVVSSILAAFSAIGVQNVIRSLR